MKNVANDFLDAGAGPADSLNQWADQLVGLPSMQSGGQAEVKKEENKAQPTQAGDEGNGLVIILIIAAIAFLVLFFIISKRKQAIKLLDDEDDTDAVEVAPEDYEEQKEKLSLAEIKVAKQATAGDMSKEELRKLRKQRRAQSQTQKAKDQRDDDAEDDDDDEAEALVRVEAKKGPVTDEEQRAGALDALLDSNVDDGESDSASGLDFGSFAAPVAKEREERASIPSLGSGLIDVRKLDSEQIKDEPSGLQVLDDLHKRKAELQKRRDESPEETDEVESSGTEQKASTKKASTKKASTKKSSKKKKAPAEAEVVAPAEDAAEPEVEAKDVEEKPKKSSKKSSKSKSSKSKSTETDASTAEADEKPKKKKSTKKDDADAEAAPAKTTKKKSSKKSSKKSVAAKEPAAEADETAEKPKKKSTKKADADAEAAPAKKTKKKSSKKSSKKAAAAKESTETDETSDKPKKKKKAAKPKEEPRSLRDGLAETRNKGFVARLGKVFSKKLDDSIVDEIEEILFTADIGVRTSEKLLELVSSKLSRKEINDGPKALAVLREEVTSILKAVEQPMSIGEARPYVILVVGVNGAGKTTTIGKVAAKLTDQGHKVLLIAGDTFRAAAIEQLQEWGERTGCTVYTEKQGADPSGVIYGGLELAKAEGYDVVLADTAGRLHNKKDLVAELQKIHKVAGKPVEGAPHRTILVLDSTNGQNALIQAKEFKEAVDYDGIIMTKLDGTAKGGVIIGICDEMKLPVHYIGIGEMIDDLRAFDAEQFVEAMF